MPNTATTTITRTRVGTASIAFGAIDDGYYREGAPFSCANALLTYRFDAGENAGRSGSIKLQRLGPSPTQCTAP
jgi:hypothetical protein